jgi:hypothetical protein
MADRTERRRVLKMIIRDGIEPVLAGLALGILTVLGLNKVSASLVYAVRPSDPATLAGVALRFGCVSLAARCFPTWRTTRIDPLVVLRTS